jgi:hypothetical protein
MARLAGYAENHDGIARNCLRELLHGLIDSIVLECSSMDRHIHYKILSEPGNWWVYV